MGKIAFVFAGQGAQKSGMGKSLAAASPAASGVFSLADSIRPGTSACCFEGTAEELKETKNTQPCLYTVEMAAAAALSEAGIRADMTAGFSLGELSALAYAGVFSVAEGLSLVMKRAELMQEASLESKTSMMAVLKLTNEQVSKVASAFNNVYPVNFNCPGQVSVSGAEEEMQEFKKAVSAAGGKAIPLKVSGAFHSPYMSKAAASFKRALEASELKAPDLPIYSNYSGEKYGEDVLSSLAPQIDHPVYWEKIVRNMINEGVDTFIELGPGNTLCGLIGKTDSTVKTYAVCEAEDLEKVIREVKGV